MISNKERGKRSQYNEWFRGVGIIILDPRQQIFCSRESKFSSNKVKVNLNTTQYLIKCVYLDPLLIADLLFYLEQLLSIESS